MDIGNININDLPKLAYLSILLIALAGGVIFQSHLKASTLLKQATLWLIIAIGAIVIYSFRFSFYDLKNRVMAELLPSRATIVNDHQIAINISQDGHYYINLMISGQKINFMIDTGASDVAVSLNDARKIGIDIGSLKFTKIYQTANGKSYGAPVILKEVRVAGLIFYDVRASVNNSDMGTSLLGMSFLNQFNKYEFYRDRLILTY